MKLGDSQDGLRRRFNVRRSGITEIDHPCPAGLRHDELLMCKTIGPFARGTDGYFLCAPYTTPSSLVTWFMVAPTQKPSVVTSWIVGLTLPASAAAIPTGR